MVSPFLIKQQTFVITIDRSGSHEDRCRALMSCYVFSGEAKITHLSLAQANIFP